MEHATSPLRWPTKRDPSDKGMSIFKWHGERKERIEKEVEIFFNCGKLQSYDNGTDLTKWLQYKNTFEVIKENSLAKYQSLMPFCQMILEMMLCHQIFSLSIFYELDDVLNIDRQNQSV